MPAHGRKQPSHQVEVPPEEDEDRGKAALTELFNEVKTPETPIIVERVVTDIDEIVRLVRFPGWQGTLAGEREVKEGAAEGALQVQTSRRRGAV
jgi:hypothetical protein